MPLATPSENVLDCQRGVAGVWPGAPDWAALRDYGARAQASAAKFNWRRFMGQNV
jgi:hypothetical protein